MSKYRYEHDSLGKVRVRSDRYWGAQTQRSLNNFRIGKQRFSRTVIKALAIVKKAAALTNGELGVLDAQKSKLISDVCDEVISGRLDKHFPLVVWQTGSGTQTNMNANEVIANRAIELAGGELGSKKPIHPNDDVNKSQSSNDCFPTVMHVAAVDDLSNKLLPALNTLRATFARHSKQHQKVIKIGRTHCMDATPLTLGQEFSGYVAQLEYAGRQIENALTHFYQIPLGGTAVGTGLNTESGYDRKVAAQIAEITSYPFRSANNKFQLLAAHDAIANASGCLKVLATVAMKIANDIRMLASGPRCGLAELRLPANEPGSSIMPGKVNPTQCEALSMVCAQVIGNDTTIAIAASLGHFQLNVFKPVMLHNLLEATGLLAEALLSFNDKCVVGLEVNHQMIAQHLRNSLMLVTALNPLIGYDKAAQVAKTAYEQNITLRDAALQLGVTAEQFDDQVRPENMIAPQPKSSRQTSKSK